MDADQMFKALIEMGKLKTLAPKKATTLRSQDIGKTASTQLSLLFIPQIINNIIATMPLNTSKYRIKIIGPPPTLLCGW